MKTLMLYREHKNLHFQKNGVTLALITSCFGPLKINRRDSSEYGTLPIQRKPGELNCVKLKEL